MSKKYYMAEKSLLFSSSLKKTVPDTLKVICNRRSVRHFTGEAVSPEQIDLVLQAAMSAPSAVNHQPWEFIVVNDRNTLDRLGDVLPYSKMLYKAGVAIVVCSVPARAYKQFTEYAVIDSALASQNILLAAEAIGLGAVWTAAYPYPERMASVRPILGIPQEVIPLNVIPIGYPTGEDMRQKKITPEKIHREKW